MCNCEFVIVVLLLRVQSKRHERQPFPTSLRHEDEAELLQAGGEVVGCTGQIEHDGAVAVFAKTDHLVVLADNLGGALGEVEGETGLVGAEIVDIEDKFFRQILGGAPDDPANAGVNLELR